MHVNHQNACSEEWIIAGRSSGQNGAGASQRGGTRASVTTALLLTTKRF
jgi:hypothetical protein